MRKKAEELNREISNFVNGARKPEVKELAELLSKDHPTLQQSTMGLAVHFIQQMANKEYTDPRNTDSKQMALAMIEGYRQHLVKKFIGQGSSVENAEKTAQYCIENLADNLPLI